MHEDSVKLGCDGSYERVTAFAHAFRVFGGVPGRGIYDSEALFDIGSRTMDERRRP